MINEVWVGDAFNKQVVVVVVIVVSEMVGLGINYSK